MLRCTCIILLTKIGSSIKCQNNKTDFWKGTMTRDGSSMNVSFEFKFAGKEQTGYFNASSQKAKGIPLDSVTQTKDSVFFQLMSDPILALKPAHFFQ